MRIIEKKKINEDGTLLQQFEDEKGFLKIILKDGFEKAPIQFNINNKAYFSFNKNMLKALASDIQHIIRKLK